MIKEHTRFVRTYEWTAPSLVEAFLKDFYSDAMRGVGELWLKPKLFDALAEELEDRFRNKLCPSEEKIEGGAMMLYGVLLHRGLG